MAFSQKKKESAPELRLSLEDQRRFHEERSMALPRKKHQGSLSTLGRTRLPLRNRLKLSACERAESGYPNSKSAIKTARLRKNV